MATATLASVRRRGSGTVRRLPSGRWQARLVRPDGTRESLGTYRTRTEADQALVQAEADQLRGEWAPTPDDPGTVGEWADRWLAGAHVRASTTRRYTGIVTALRRTWRSRAVTAVARDDVRGWATEMLVGGSAPATVQYAVGTLRRILALAVEAGVLVTNPATGVRLPTPHPADIHPLTIEQVDAPAVAIEHPELRPAGNGAKPTGRATRPDLALAVRLAAYCGLRAGELWGLRRRDVHLGPHPALVVEQSVTAGAGGRLTTGPTKGGRDRRVPLPAALVEPLRAHLADHPGPPNGLVFTSSTGTPIRHGQVYRRHFQPALVRAGLPTTTR